MLFAQHALFGEDAIGVGVTREGIECERQRLHRHFTQIDALAIELVAGTQQQLRQSIQHIEFGDAQPGQAVDAAGTAQGSTMPKITRSLPAPKAMAPSL